MNVYEMINIRLTELLEQGTVPWRKPWNAENRQPTNLISKKAYRGVNVFLLACQSYFSPYWLTFNQCKERGGFVRRGEKGTPVIFWKWLDKTTEDDSLPSVNGKIPLLRYYTVFNVEQCEGIKAPAVIQACNLFSPIEKADLVLQYMPMKPEIRHGGSRAYYSPSLDYIQLPEEQSFCSAEEYHNTLFHECIHATGHANRLARKSILEPSYFGSHDYSKEELVAEMGAAFLSAHAGIAHQTIENSAAYIQGWLKALKNDRTLMVYAAAQAQKAAEFILNKQAEQEEEPA